MQDCCWEHPVSVNLSDLPAVKEFFFVSFKKKKPFSLEQKRQRKLGKAIPYTYNNLKNISTYLNYSKILPTQVGTSSLVFMSVKRRFGFEFFE